MTTKYLADINFWLALAFEFHQSHATANACFETQDDNAIVFCRMTQLGFLRLASDRRVFLEEALTLVDAWNAYDQMAADPRVGPFNDAYLAAFAQAADLEILTFDQGFSQYRGLNSTILS